jgi:DNA-directed RNA polymerase specialized sigma24 family protein
MEIKESSYLGDRPNISDHNPTVRDTLTPAQFAGLLERLDGQPERAGEKYETLRWKLVKFFQWSYCLAAEDLADITLDRVARKLATESIEDVEAFTWGVAKKIRLEAQKRNLKTVSLESLPGEHTISDAGTSMEALHQKIQSQKEMRCLRQCLSRLSAEDRVLFLAYRVDKGHYEENRKNLARQFGLTLGALRVRIIRIREKLEQCLDRSLRRND